MSSYPPCPFCGGSNFRIEGTPRSETLRCITPGCAINSRIIKVKDWIKRPVEAELRTMIREIKMDHTWTLPEAKQPPQDKFYPMFSEEVMVMTMARKIYAPAYLVIDPDYKDHWRINRYMHWFFDNEFFPFMTVLGWQPLPPTTKQEVYDAELYFQN